MSEAGLAPGSTIGILGGGQLGRMLAIAAARLGLKTHIFEPGHYITDRCGTDVESRKFSQVLGTNRLCVTRVRVDQLP